MTQKTKQQLKETYTQSLLRERKQIAEANCQITPLERYRRDNWYTYIVDVAEKTRNNGRGGVRL